MTTFGSELRSIDIHRDNLRFMQEYGETSCMDADEVFAMAVHYGCEFMRAALSEPQLGPFPDLRGALN